MSQGHRAAPAGRGRASQRTYMVRRLVALAFVVALGWGLVSVIATVFGDGDPQQAAAVQPTIITVVNDGQPTTVPIITAPPTVVTEPPVKERTVPSAENPAELLILGPTSARLTLHEGRYHQVKRMFGHFHNKVIGLHRESMGPLHLDPHLAPGQYRPLSADEIALI